MTKQRFYCWLFFLLPVVYFLSLPISTGDLSVWVAHGKYFLSHGHVLRHDIYSVMPTKDLVYPVGICVLYALIYPFGGLIGVSLFHKLIILFISYLWYRYSLLKLKNPWSNLSLLLIFLTWLGSSILFIERPALVAIVPLLVSFLILQKEEELSTKDLIYLNLINIAWVNIHGSWPLLLGMYLWREFSRFVLLKKKISWQQPVAVCSFVLTSLMNPFGFKIYPYIVETAVLSRERNILEWESLSFSGLYATQTIFISILVAVFLISAGFLFRTSKEKFKKAVTSPFLPLLMLGLQNNRNTSLPFFVAIPFMCEFIFEKGEEKSEDKRKSPLNYVFLAGVFACLILFFPTLKPYTQGLLPGNKAEVYDKFTVPSIADYLNHTVDNDVVFNDWGYGSFLILAQKHPIFIDTRNIIFSNKDMHECASVFRAVSGWETILEKYKARYIILNTTMHAPLTESLEKSSKWELVMKEKSSLLFRKKD